MHLPFAMMLFLLRISPKHPVLAFLLMSLVAGYCFYKASHAIRALKHYYEAGFEDEETDGEVSGEEEILDPHDAAELLFKKFTFGEITWEKLNERVDVEAKNNAIADKVVEAEALENEYLAFSITRAELNKRVLQSPRRQRLFAFEEPNAELTLSTDA